MDRSAKEKIVNTSGHQLFMPVSFVTTTPKEVKRTLGRGTVINQVENSMHICVWICLCLSIHDSQYFLDDRNEWKTN